jgi:hypothetical protein
LSSPTPEQWQKLRAELGVSPYASTHRVVGRQMFCPGCGHVSAHFKNEGARVVDQEYGCICADWLLLWANPELRWYRENGTVTT